MPLPISMPNIRGIRRFLISTATIMKGNMKSKTATRLVREWIDLRLNELEEDWQLARAGKEIKKIDPLE